VIDRRRFLAGTAAVLLAAPLAAEAQPVGTTYRIAFLGGASAPGYGALVEELRLGLRGYVEGKNITIEYRWAEGKYHRLPALAAELVRLKVDVIITQGVPAALAPLAAATTMGMVFVSSCSIFARPAPPTNRTSTLSRTRSTAPARSSSAVSPKRRSTTMF
jgi:putative tryptophan/tyrosine transport system substrate-binding protein